MPKFNKKHLRDKRNISDLRKFHKSVLKDYILLFQDAFKNNYDFAVKFLMWLKQYLALFKNEKFFKPTFLPQYQRGQIVLVNLGYRIGYELGGPHYGIVLDHDNRKKSGLITIVPLVSKKEKHFLKGLKPWEYEIPYPISLLVIKKGQEILDVTKNLPLAHEIVRAAQSFEQAYTQNPDTALEEATQAFSQKLEKQINPILALSKKLNKGSIVDTQQIITVSKQRIITPTKRSDELYNVCIPESTLSEITALIRKQYF